MSNIITVTKSICALNKYLLWDPTKRSLNRYFVMRECLKGYYHSEYYHKFFEVSTLQPIWICINRIEIHRNLFHYIDNNFNNTTKACKIKNKVFVSLS